MRAVLDGGTIFNEVDTSLSTVNQKVSIELKIQFGFDEIWKGLTNNSFHIEVLDDKAEKHLIVVNGKL